MKQRIRFLEALAGSQTDRIATTLHNFMPAAVEAGISMHQYREDPSLMAKALIEATERYGYDCVLVDMDTVTLAGALGVPVDFPEGEPARSHFPAPFELGDFRNLPLPQVGDYTYIRNLLEAVRLIKKHFGDEVAVRGNCDQLPFSLACARRTPARFFMDLADANEEGDDSQIFALLDYCWEALRQLMTLMSQTGADILSNGDSPAGPEIVSPAYYRRYAFPYERKAAALSHELGKPYILHICGKTDVILADMVDTGADGLELDFKTDIALAEATLRGRCTFIGNIDPSAVLAMGTPALVRSETEKLLQVFAGNPRFILNAGCALPSTTPGENIRALLDCARPSWNQSPSKV